MSYVDWTKLLHYALLILHQLTDCISQISNIQIGNTKHLDVAMHMYNIRDYSHVNKGISVGSTLY